MARKRLIWQIYPPFLLVILIALLTVSWVFSRSLNTFYTHEIKKDLIAQGSLVIPQVLGFLDRKNGPYLDSLSKNLGRKTGTRFTIILLDGYVLGDSEENPALMDNHATRPEIIEAAKGQIGVSTRFSHTLQQKMMYAALPVEEEGQVTGCVRVALPVRTLAQTLEAAFYPVIKSGLAIALVAALISLWLSRRISRPLEEMKRGAERFAHGDLESRLPVYYGEEIGGLAEAMNQMAAQLDDRIKTVVRQRNEQEAVLSSMVEGVMAIDNDERILRINQSAADLLNIDPPNVIGRRIQEITRKPNLQNFFSKALQSQASIEEDITLTIRGNELFLQAHGTLLRDSTGKDIGALVVLNDITRLQRLENIRRDFVANVSHELKTPITAIKGSVETLLDGAVKDSMTAERFLEIINRQSDRLNAIIEDLLSLSRIEQGEGHETIEFCQKDIRPILINAIQACQMKAQEQKVSLDLECSKDLTSSINAALLEQAMVNLIDNAIKYSYEDNRIHISAFQDGPNVVIRVQDWGCGISEEHLPRLFERFYRVDKARSRKLGGTGLGLAIVKHIIQSHNGTVSVESTPEKGSTFTLEIPAN